MAVLVARADGNLTAASTWGVVDATSFLAYEEPTSAETTVTTTYVESSAFTPGAITVDAIAVKVATRAASPSGTISVRLAQAGATVAGTEVTINVSDIEGRATEIGWYLFTFAAPVTLVAATAYTLSVKTSVATQVTLFRDTTAANWSRMLRTTTTAAPAAGDSFFILGQWTAAGTKTDRAVTMDSTAATDYGNGAAITVANPAGVAIGKGGTLSYGIAAATNYILRLSTSLIVWQGGRLNVGTSLNPIPRDSSAVLEFDPVSADGDFGLTVFGTFNSAGLSRTSGKDVIQCLLNTDEAVGQTDLGVDTDTGWLSGDLIAIGTTTLDSNGSEVRTLASNAGAANVVVTVGLSSAHSGTAPSQGEVVLLTRNVQVRSTSTTLMAFVRCGQVSVVSCAWTLFRYLGATTTGKRGIELETTTGSCTLSYCALANFDFHGILLTGTAVNNVTVSHAGIWNVGGSGAALDVLDTTTGTNCSFSDITIIDTVSNGIKFASALPGPVRRVRIAGARGIGLIVGTIGTMVPVRYAMDTFNVHGCNGAGLEFNTRGGLIENITTWRNNPGGGHGGFFVGDAVGTVFDTATSRGNWGFGASNFAVASNSNGVVDVVVRNLRAGGEAGYDTPNGVLINSTGLVAWSLTFENCVFGSGTGLVGHTTSDINWGGSVKWVRAILRNTTLSSTTKQTNTASLLAGSEIHYHREGGSVNAHSTNRIGRGTVAYETGVFRTATPSEKLTPNGATSGYRLRSGVRWVPVATGKAVSVAAYVRKDSAYTGDAPRLVLLSNAALGVDKNLTLATHSAAADTWQQLSGTSTPVAEEDGVLGFVVECDGSAGNVYVDDWSVS